MKKKLAYIVGSICLALFLVYVFVDFRTVTEDMVVSILSGDSKYVIEAFKASAKEKKCFEYKPLYGNKGPSYGAVVSIIGKHGVKVMETQSVEYEGDRTTTYQWDNYDGSNLVICFTSGNGQMNRLEANGFDKPSLRKTILSLFSGTEGSHGN